MSLMHQVLVGFGSRSRSRSGRVGDSAQVRLDLSEAAREQLSSCTPHEQTKE
jgi:hypothetical protein